MPRFTGAEPVRGTPTVEVMVIVGVTVVVVDETSLSVTVIKSGQYIYYRDSGIGANQLGY